MAQGIIHYNGVYNIWSTVMDSPLYATGLTREMVVDHIHERAHSSEDVGPIVLAKRFELAHKNGCDDDKLGHTLDDLIACNRAGPNGTHMEKVEFLAKFFTVEK